ncbi:fungal-specific transcription factor domain-containing protein [Boletus edulis]|uniref:Fungal-specific transcription factor domain-containing protein n=1 Tax=Boletus edulis BED1 TaxID=1328754 RepID=A0AAD4GJR7_BOLED|nr:fungal-specific transcription factor domain-containing protein [Boletus edulis]KAF8448092.1 fungal-specific transcription factor domain-containing protein [Boletus edulis BED1]
MPSRLLTYNSLSSKQPVVRNPRACTVCRAAKMKCVGAEDGDKPCQRCKRTNVECIFEKHRRGRKPGSKLSEASKMLRRLEKGLNTAKLKQANESSMSSVFPAVDSRSPQGETQFGTLIRPMDPYNTSASGNRPSDGEDEEDRGDEKFPAKLIRKENSFFRTILNPEPKSPYPNIAPLATRSDLDSLQLVRPAGLPAGFQDPITAALISEDKAKMLFDAIFLRLNPFINLFDPQLHSVNYVRSKCPFLFTTLIATGCKFFEPSLYKECLHLANELAVRAFAEGWKGVEVVQAFACLTYWREQDDNRTWMYIGYACRMAVELGLNRFLAKPPANEGEFQLLERRNRERTYLVLFVHDRSLSMQTGRHWMLPEDDFIRHADTWHEQGGSPIRCEDVVVAAFIQLRRIAAETTDMLHTNRSQIDGGNGQINVDMALKNANAKLSQWSTRWEHEMRRANGESFHFSFLNLFCLYSSLFLNSFGVQADARPEIRTNSHLRALSACFENALGVLKIASKDFRDLGVLRYGQESTTVMTAYSAIFLLKVGSFRFSNTVVHRSLVIAEFRYEPRPAIRVARGCSTRNSRNYNKDG